MPETARQERRLMSNVEWIPVELQTIDNRQWQSSIVLFCLHPIDKMTDRLNDHLIK